MDTAGETMSPAYQPLQDYDLLMAIYVEQTEETQVRFLEEVVKDNPRRIWGVLTSLGCTDPRDGHKVEF